MENIAERMLKGPQNSQLRHYATGRKVAGSIPNDVTGFFKLANPSSRPRVDSASNRNEYQKSSLR
jgi:hypothetical protein